MKSVVVRKLKVSLLSCRTTFTATERHRCSHTAQKKTVPDASAAYWCEPLNEDLIPTDVLASRRLEAYKRAPHCHFILYMHEPGGMVVSVVGW